MKTCSRCKESKGVEEFYRDRGTRDGRYAYCKPCGREKKAEWAAANPEKTAAASRRFRENPNNAQKLKEYNDAWRAANPDKCKEYAKRSIERPGAKEAKAERRRQTDYGLRPGQFDEMREVQEGKCLICGIVPSDTLCVDHNHSTGSVRGLLCRKCNRFLGGLEPHWESAVGYLARFETGS